MAEIVLNDVIIELREENNRLSNELLFANKCLELFKKYRNYLTVLCLNCNCDKNINNKLKYNELEEEYNALYNTVITNNNIGIEKSAEISNEFNCKTELTSEMISHLTSESKINIKQKMNYSNQSKFRRRRIIKRKIDKDYDYSKFGGFGTGFACKSGYKARPKRVGNDERQHRCDWPECTSVFKSSIFLKQHMRTHTGEKPHACEWPGCESSFARIQHLEQHKLNHREILYSCDFKDCNYQAKQLKNLLTHKLRHTGIRLFECKTDDCSMSFKTKGELNRHIRRLHSDLRPYSCDWPDCDKTFKFVNQLTLHMRSHTGEKPLKCLWPGCDKSFNITQQLNSHTRTHTGVKPYKCSWPGCEWRFAELPRLVRHQKIHQEVSNYVCNWPECGKKFRERYNLNKHLLMHRGERPFKCPECDRRFTVKGNMVTHLKRHQQKA